MGKLDILSREKFVCRILNLIDNISANKSSTCFAINGPWGCGKTFVLDMLKERLENIHSDETQKDKFLVIPYNCWKFDYYEEPLVAIVSSIMSTIEEKTKLFPDSKQKSEILGMLKAIGVSLFSITADAAKAKTGIDVRKAYETVKSGIEAGSASYEDEHEYDAYFNFNKVLNELSKLISKLSEQYTIIFLLDELDRCLPEYSIKILERIHHLTEDQKNIITIISIDKIQLETQVKNVFGFENPEKYLEKFINFEVKLDNGYISDAFSEKYKDYIELFSRDIFPITEPYEECLQAIFSDVNIRVQEQIMRKVMLAHKILYSGEKDYSFMCMEILLAVMICVYHDDSCFTGDSVNLSSFGSVFIAKPKLIKPAFADFFENKFKNVEFSRDTTLYDETNIIILPPVPNLYGAMLYIWFWMHRQDNNPKVVIQYRSTSVYYRNIEETTEEMKKFADMIKMLS